MVNTTAGLSFLAAATNSDWPVSRIQDNRVLTGCEPGLFLLPLDAVLDSNHARRSIVKINAWGEGFFWRELRNTGISFRLSPWRFFCQYFQQKVGYSGMHRRVSRPLQFTEHSSPISHLHTTHYQQPSLYVAKQPLCICVVFRPVVANVFTIKRPFITHIWCIS